MEDNKTAVQVAEEKHLKRDGFIKDLKKLNAHRELWENAASIHHVILVQQRGSNYSDQSIIPSELMEPVRAMTLHVIKKEIEELEIELINL